MTRISQPRSFTLFPLLPIEIRNEIYTCTIQPRLVRIGVRKTREDGQPDVHNDHTQWQCHSIDLNAFHIFSPASIPALLHTCQESRSAMQRAGYELAFRYKATLIWYNFKSDILYVGTHTCGLGMVLMSKDWARLERLAMEESGALYDFSNLVLISKFKHLQELLCVLHAFRTQPETEGDLMGYMEYGIHERVKIGKKEYNQALLRDHRDYLAEWLPIPEIKHVFVLPKQLAAEILRQRKAFWDGASGDPFDKDNHDAIMELRGWRGLHAGRQDS